jgi:alkaline phosphatase
VTRPLRSLATWGLLLLVAHAGAACATEKRWLDSGRRSLTRAKALTPTSTPARNAILFVGDGMGLTTVTAARILEGQLRGEPGEENTLAFETLPHVSLTKTYNTNQQTADSAGTMTALVTGAKTRAGVVSVDETVARGDAAGVEGHRLRTLFEAAEARGLATGVVTTTTVTHATPAACYAHSPERGWEDDSRLSPAARELGFPDIARQLLEFPHGDGLEVVLGGGRAQFLPHDATDPEHPSRRGARLDGRDLSAEWTARLPRARYVWSRPDFDAVRPAETDHLLGLFEPRHMNFESDRAEDPAGEPSLSEMTAKALAILSRNPRGFVLMVEGGRIDHGHHMSNAYRALVDTIEFSNAVRTALQRTDPAETLIVVTADHGNVLSIGGYPTRGNPILGKVVENDARGEPAGFSTDALGLPYTTLGYQNGAGYSGATDEQPEGAKRVTRSVAGQQGIREGRPDLSEVDTAAPDYLQETTVPMRSETHSAEDVPVYAGGPGAHLFHGVQEQSYVYHAIVEALGWNRAAGER